MAVNIQDPANLPDDPETLKGIIDRIENSRRDLLERKDELKKEITHLEKRLTRVCSESSLVVQYLAGLAGCPQSDLVQNTRDNLEYGYLGDTASTEPRPVALDRPNEGARAGDPAEAEAALSGSGKEVAEAASLARSLRAGTMNVSKEEAANIIESLIQRSAEVHDARIEDFANVRSAGWAGATRRTPPADEVNAFPLAENQIPTFDRLVELAEQVMESGEMLNFLRHDLRERARFHHDRSVDALAAAILSLSNADPETRRRKLVDEASATAHGEIPA